MNKCFKPDYTIDILTVTRPNTGGVSTSALYSGLYAELMLGQGSEALEGMREVDNKVRQFRIYKDSAQTINESNMLTFDGEDYDIVDVHPYVKDRDFLVIKASLRHG